MVPHEPHSMSQMRFSTATLRSSRDWEFYCSTLWKGMAHKSLKAFIQIHISDNSK